jgi:hypothetical protein
LDAIKARLMEVVDLAVNVAIEILVAGKTRSSDVVSQLGLGARILEAARRNKE